MTREQFEKLPELRGFYGAVGYGPHAKRYYMGKAISSDRIMVCIGNPIKAVYYSYKSIHFGEWA